MAAADAERAAPAATADDGGNAELLLKRLEWTVLRRLDGLLQGDHRTLMRGAGLDLADIAKYLSFGASPRATIGLIEGARALAFMRGRSYALPEDMTGLVGDVLRHRLVLSYEALAEGIDANAVVQRVMKKIPVPDKPLAPENAGHGRG